MKILTAFLLATLCSLSIGETVTLDTPQGTLIGETAGPNGEVSTFKGIPYAAAPVGDRRWRAPVEPRTWPGELLATDYGPNCIQAPYDRGTFYYRAERLTSEDCLYLNVWSNDTSTADKPVMVWIHGGALTRGSGATPTYDGTNLALKDVVLVTINYRLGVFGYFAHPELRAESADQSAGNYGILDQIQALQWVQDNIAAFGGDANNVTIFGESAGSWSVNYLSASPLAEGLFHKAIGESGGRLDTNRTVEQAAEQGMELARALNADSLSALRDIPALDLLAGANANRFVTDGVVDGWVIPDQPYTLFSQGRYNQTPLLVGYNADEGTTLGALYRVPENDDVYIAQANNQYGDLAGEFLDIYPSSDLRGSTISSSRDRSFGWNMVTWAKMAERQGDNAYLYFFTYAPPNGLSQGLGAYHTGEIAYAFNNPQAHDNEALREVDENVAQTISDYWVQFAKTGNPNAEGLPEWPRFTASRLDHMVLGNSAEADEMLSPAAWEFYDKIKAASRN
jgi:para-nitrobenzyl esterase